MESLTAVMTLEGWVQLYHRSADCAGVEKAPVLNNNDWAFLFYFVYIVTMSLFFMQLVLAFVVVTYERVSHELTDRCGLSALGYKCLS